MASLSRPRHALLAVLLVLFCLLSVQCFSFQSHSGSSHETITFRGTAPPLCLLPAVEARLPIVGLFIGVSHFRNRTFLDTPAHAVGAAVMFEPFFHAGVNAGNATPVALELRAPVYAYTKDTLGSQVHRSLSTLHFFENNFWVRESTWDDDQYLHLASQVGPGLDGIGRGEIEWLDRKSDRFVTKDTILELLTTAASTAQRVLEERGEVFLIVYISSHGFIGPDGNQYIIPSDAHPKKRTTWLAYEDVIDKLLGLPLRLAGANSDRLQVVLIIDACQFEWTEGTEQQPIGPVDGISVITAAAPGQYAYHWLTTQVLQEGEREVLHEKRFGFPRLPKKLPRGPYVMEFVAKMSVLPRANQLALRELAASRGDPVGVGGEISVVDWIGALVRSADYALAESPAFVQEREARQDITVVSRPVDGAPFLTVGLTVYNQP